MASVPWRNVETSVETWGVRDRAPSEEWPFEADTVPAAGEDMRSLTAEIHTSTASAAK